MILSEGVLHVPGLFKCQEGTDIRKVSTFFRKFGSLARNPLLGDLCPSNSIIAIGHVRGWTQGGTHPPGWSLLLVLYGSIGEWLTGCHIGRFAHPW